MYKMKKPNILAKNHGFRMNTGLWLLVEVTGYEPANFQVVFA